MGAQITIIGLSPIGASLGLALAPHKSGITRIGIDRKPDVSLDAKNSDAIDKNVFNLEKSVDQSDVVILCLPPSEVQETLKIIAPGLREGAVVLDTSPLPVSAQQWAREILAPHNPFLSFFPTLNPAIVIPDAPLSAQADLFKGGLAVISCGNNTPPQAVELAGDLAKLIQAIPLFCEPQEFQGWHASTHSLPQLAASALFARTTAQSGWQDALKISGCDFAAVARLSSEADASVWLDNRENLLRVLDQYILSLQEMRRLLQAGESQPLQQWIEGTREHRQTWEKQRAVAGQAPSLSKEASAPAETLASAVGLTQFLNLFKSKKQS